MARGRVTTFRVSAAGGRPHTPPLERVPIRLKRKRALDSIRGRIFCGKPVSTFPENALMSDAGRGSGTPGAAYVVIQGWAARCTARVHPAAHMEISMNGKICLALAAALVTTGTSGTLA